MRRRQTDYEYLLDTGVFQALSVRNCESLERTGVRIMAGQFVPFELVSALDLEKLCAEISNTVDSSVLRRRLTHNPVFIRTKEEATRVSSSFVETVLAEVERFTAGAKKELEDEGLAGSHVNYSGYVRRLEQSGACTAYDQPTPASKKRPSLSAGLWQLQRGPRVRARRGYAPMHRTRNYRQAGSS